MIFRRGLSRAIGRDGGLACRRRGRAVGGGRNRRFAFRRRRGWFFRDRGRRRRRQGERAVGHGVHIGDDLGALFGFREALHHRGARNIGLRIFKERAEAVESPLAAGGLQRAGVIETCVTRDRPSDNPPKIRAGAIGAAFIERVAGFAQRRATFASLGIGRREQRCKVDRSGSFRAGGAF